MTPAFAPATPNSRGATAPALKGRVLVIDDDRGPRESLRILLKYEYEVLVATSVEEGVTELKANKFDVIVMDNRMPGRSGMEGLQDVREIDANVSIIMLTGYGTIETACEAFRNHATDFMTKPPDTDAMLAAVAKNIALTRSKRSRDNVSKALTELNMNLSAELSETRSLAKLGQHSDEIIHDLGNPLTILTCCIDLLQNKVDEMQPESSSQWVEALGYIQMIKKSVQHCCGLAEAWRQLRDDITQDRAPTAARQFLTDAVDAVLPIAAMSGARLDVAFAEGTEGDIVIDPVQMRRVAHNLIINAIQATTIGRGVVRVRGGVSDGYFEYSVTDNGTGIPAERLAIIFEPYFSTKKEGTGLGLAISRRIVDEHGGTLRAESEVGRGSTFTVRLPLVGRG